LTAEKSYIYKEFKTKNEMKKQFYILKVLLTILLFPFISKAQTNYEDVVYLKNGSIIHGIIIEQIPNKSIKLQTRDGNVFVYKIDEIEKMTKEQVKSSKNNNTNLNNDEIKHSGYTNITEMNFGLGLGQYSSDYSFGIQTINGYLFNPYFSMGIGIGVDRYKNVTFVPLFADLRVNFLQTNVTPFLSGGIGYSLGTDKVNKGGLLVNPALGVKFFVSSKAALNFSIGYRLQENSFTYYYYGTYKESSGYLNFKLGATF